MTLPRTTSTSTRDAAPPAVGRKNLRLSAPNTSTTSSDCHDETDRRARELQAAHSMASTVLRPDEGGRGTTTRNVQSTSPLGNTRSAGA